MYKKILIATDGSDHSEEAEKHGLTLAKQLGAAVTALYVVEAAHPSRSIVSPPSLMMEEHLEEMEKKGKEIVEKVAQKGEDMGVEVDPMVVDGHPANQIIKHSAHSDLVVMGTLGVSGFSHLLMGSVAEKVVRHAPVPVLVVRSKAHGKD
ncbi:MAG: universal stress protein [Candidatus Methanofastidiosia archaeon]|jgi:nucleotide-binding universal stress UspA family protein